MQNKIRSKDTFFVDSSSIKRPEDSPSTLSTTVFPDGHRVHSIDRTLYDRAIKNAMKENS
jgi:hypothetical protein